MALTALSGRRPPLALSVAATIKLYQLTSAQSFIIEPGGRAGGRRGGHLSARRADVAVHHTTTNRSAQLAPRRGN